MTTTLDNPTRARTLDALARYWPRGAAPVEALPMREAAAQGVQELPPRMEWVRLPDWAEDVGVDGVLLVPGHVVSAAGRRAAWEQTDWLAAARWYLHGTAERAHERRSGPIDSYSFRLRGWDERMWQRAWVNRIALFLRRWAAREHGTDERTLLGPLPPAEIVLTHDVDAVAKTLAIRLKQTVFHALNAGRLVVAGRLLGALQKTAHAARFLLWPGRYWRFDEIVAAESRRGLRSHFNFYGGPGGRRRTPKQRLFDPAYRVDEPRLAGVLRRLREGGWTVGLHQSFDARDDARLMRAQRRRLEEALGGPVTSCRQHWLRFSWERTWRAQEDAGLRLDSTLGFNDRPGFRNSAALRFRPWCDERLAPLDLEALPLVLMDSQLHDYQPGARAELAQRIGFWLDEVRAVRGTATVLWHPHTLSGDYGWAEGFDALLRLLSERDA